MVALLPGKKKTVKKGFASRRLSVGDGEREGTKKVWKISISSFGLWCHATILVNVVGRRCRENYGNEIKRIAQNNSKQEKGSYDNKFAQSFPAKYSNETRGCLQNAR